MVRRLLEDGNNVVVIDSLERDNREMVDKRAKLHVGNLLDEPFVSNIFSEEFD